MTELTQQMEFAMRQFNKLQKLKKEVENNKLDNRNDVQVLRKKIASLNQELIYSKQEMEQTKQAYDTAKNLFDTQTSQKEQYVEHLTIISENHKKEQEKQLSQLMSAMKMSNSNTIQSQEDNK